MPGIGLPHDKRVGDIDVVGSRTYGLLLAIWQIEGGGSVGGNGNRPTDKAVAPFPLAADVAISC